MTDIESNQRNYRAYSDVKFHDYYAQQKANNSLCYEVIPLETDYLSDPQDLNFYQSHTKWHKFCKFLLVLCTFPLSLIWLCCRVYIVPDGCVGLSCDGGKRVFLPPGWHFLASPLRSLVRIVNLNSTEATQFYPRGFCLVSDGYIMLARQNGRYVILGPGFHLWDDPMFECENYYKLSERNVLTLGPYSVITVPPGEIAITENNGVLVMLDQNETTGKRCHFLNHANWKYRGMLSTQRQIDSVNVNVTTADRVEVQVSATTAWGITDAKKAAMVGGHNMEQLQKVVHRSAQGVLANMISDRKISDGAVGAVVREDGTVASKRQLEHCNNELAPIGVEISEIAIVQMHIVSEATRLEIAKIAAIPAKTKELRDVADAQAESAVISAKGQATAMLELAQAEAASIRLIAEARKAAGDLLGESGGTAANLAYIEATGQALKNAKSSVFFVPPGDVRPMMANQSLFQQ